MTSTHHVLNVLSFSLITVTQQLLDMMAYYEIENKILSVNMIINILEI